MPQGSVLLEIEIAYVDYAVVVVLEKTEAIIVKRGRKRDHVTFKLEGVGIVPAKFIV